MSGDVLSCIHKKMSALSKGQKRIAAYILDSYDKAAFLTAGALGKAAQVSESTVVRFAAELGYSGYPEMQKALQEMVLNRLTTAQRMEISGKRLSEHDILTSVFQSDAERIRTTGEEMDRNAFSRAVEAILGAKTIYILGVRSSSALASFLGFYFRYMFDDVRVITTAASSEMFESIVRISPQDVAIGISFPRYSTATCKALQFCRHSGAATVALTDSPTAPPAQYADCLLTAKSDMVSLVDSLVAPMSLINALIAAVAARREAETTDVFSKLEGIWDRYHVYEKGDE